MGLTSREEDILRATIDGTEYNKPPQSRVEELLIELKEAIEEGGGGGGSVVTITPTLESGEKIADYSINGVEGELYAPEGGGGSSIRIVDKLYEAPSGAGAPLQTEISYLDGHKLSDYDMVTVVLSSPSMFRQGTYTQMNSFAPRSLYLPVPKPTSQVPPSRPVCLVAKDDGLVCVSFQNTNFEVIGHGGVTDDEPSVYCIYGVKFSHVEEEIEINPVGQPTGTINTLGIGDDIYNVGGSGGTEVVANPEGEATDVLEKLQVGEDIYSVSGKTPDVGTGERLIYTLGAGQRWEYFTNPKSDYPIIVEARGGYGTIARAEIDASKLPSRDGGGDNYVTVLTIPNALGQSINMAIKDSGNTICISSDNAFDTSTYSVMVYEKFYAPSTYTEEVIYESTTDTGGSRTITLSKELRNFDAIYFKYWTVGEPETYLDSANTPMYDTNPNSKGKVYIVSYPGYGNRYIIFEGTPTELTATLTTGAWNEVNYRPGIYQIVGVRYGNDEAKPFKKELLWKGEAYTANNTGHLGKPITEYPFLMMYWSDSSVSGQNDWHVELVDTSKLTNYEVETFSFEYYITSYTRGTFTDSSNFKITASISESGIYTVLREIYGVDFGSGAGNGGAFQKDLLYAASSAAGAPLQTDIPYLTNRNFFDYDLILMIQCNTLDTGNTNLILSPFSFTPDELYKIDEGVYTLCTSGYKERYFTVNFSEHSFNIPTHAANNETGEYAPSLYKMYGFKFGGSGSGGKAVSKYLPETYKSDIACEATLDNFDSTSISWGEGPDIIHLSDPVSIQDGGVLIPVKSDAVFASVDRKKVGRPFTAYIVAKLVNPDQGARIMSAMYSHTSNKGILLCGNPVVVSSWANDTVTSEESTDYFVGVMQYSIPGIAFGKVNDTSEIWKPSDKIGQEIVIGRTDIDPSGSDEAPSDIIVKYFAVVDQAESIGTIRRNVASLMERFGIS